MTIERTPPLALEQEQFLQVLSRDEAVSAFCRALEPRPLGIEAVCLDQLRGRALARSVAAPVDIPPFDRSVVDGFAVQAGDVATASGSAPVRLSLNQEVVTCGTLPRLRVGPGSATPIATGSPIPRGADAVVMVENTEPDRDATVLVKRAVSPGQYIAFAGSDIVRGQTLLHQGTIVGAREIGLLAAVGLARLDVWHKPRIGVISTGDELIEPGVPLQAAMIYDSNGPIIAAALEENGCTPVRFGVVVDDEEKLRRVMHTAFESCDGIILSGGTSKGSGDLTYRLIDRLGKPGIIAHGVALKPGKPLCLAVCSGKPVVVLPGFPTSAMFTFHDVVAPVLRILAGLPERPETQVTARVPMRIASELGRTEFVMVALMQSDNGLVAHPIGKGSGAVTAFSQADGYLKIDALAAAIPANTPANVHMLNAHSRLPDLVIIGSHCVGLDTVVEVLSERGITTRMLALGSLGGLAALTRGECDIAPIHLLDPKTGRYNHPFLSDETRLVPGWRRMQGFVFRRGDHRFEGRALEAAIAAALSDPDCIMVNRNQGAGTRLLIDNLLKDARPTGYWNQPRSHNGVVASVAQSRADWGVAIKPAADDLGLGFIPLTEEHFDFAVRVQPRSAGILEAFQQALLSSMNKLRQLGLVPAQTERGSE
jgi:putative molybdopterin biosynthesis protein